METLAASALFRLAEVNEYLRMLTGEDYTAKDFRAWSGTIPAALVLQAFEQFNSEAQAKKNIACAIKSVAKKKRQCWHSCKND